MTQWQQALAEIKRGCEEVLLEEELIAKLKELEQDNLITRIVYQQVPPKVEYELTALGRSLEEILTLMDKWGEDNLPESML